DGRIDELRISTGIARPADWLATSYNNQNDPAVFYSVGSEEVNPATAITLNFFSATGRSDGVMVTWQTAQEVDTLGFNLYRSSAEGAPRTKINTGIIPGLISSVSGRTYAYLDHGATRGISDYYFLEEVDLGGRWTLYGPVRADWPGTAVNGVSASDDGAADETGAGSPGYGVLDDAIAAAGFQESAAPAQYSREGWSVPAGPALKISVRHDGWYRISQPALAEAGLADGIDPVNLQLYADGQEMPLVVSGEDDGRFDAEDAIEFYGQGLDTPFTDTRIYWLVAGSRPGARLRKALGCGLRPASGSFAFSAELQERLFFFASLSNGEDENFLGAIVVEDSVEQLITVDHPAPAPAADALLEVALQGASEVSHHVGIKLNNTEMGELLFEGQKRGVAEIAVSHKLLKEGDNSVRLEPLGGELDVSMVDYVRITYQRAYTADNDTLQCSARGGALLTIDGFSDPDIRVVDITEPAQTVQVLGRVKPSGPGYAVRARVPYSGQRTLLAFSEQSIKSPSAVAVNVPSDWLQERQGAICIIITRGDLLESFEPLKEHREQQGVSVVLVDVADLYDEFNFGAKSPWALRDFLQQAYSTWLEQPYYVLLAGDASFDPRNYLGIGDFDLVPAKMVDTLDLKVPSDDWFVDFDDDGLPEMAVGRIPVNSADEAAVVVDKIIAYDLAATRMDTVLFAADLNGEYNYEEAGEDAAELVPEDFTVRIINRSLGDGAKADLLESINDGPLLVNYIGHGSTDLWTGSFLTTADVLSLTNFPDLPFVVEMTCLNGYFLDPELDSLVEALLKSVQGGAIAVWASSGLTDPADQMDMNAAMIELVLGEQDMTLGEAAVLAKEAAFSLDVRKTWILFGDPLTRLRLE
ncbi:MAG: hypothetical protein GY868_16025, partial [Deltaproteobacteria bacterium]|nr:hypothetical protein [Deltaproteobacteria bacterium]